MATPKTGAISFSQLSTEILQAGSTSQRTLNSAGVRMGYGSTAQVSMSDLRGCFGGTVISGTRPGSTTFQPDSVGWIDDNPTDLGSIDDQTYHTDHFILSLYSVVGFGETVLGIGKAGGANPDAGWQGTDINRIARSDTLRTLGTSSATQRYFSEEVSGEFTFGIRWG